MPHLLIDSLHAQGAAHVLPHTWLAGLTLSTYTPGELLDVASGSEHGTHPADAVMLRSVTPVSDATLVHLPHLRAVATCSSGTDHVDLQALQAADIAMFSGRGGNAIAVSEWVAWALCRQWGTDLLSPKPWAGRRIVVVGVGAVGGCVRALARHWGADVVCVDPPRARRDPEFAADPAQTSLAEALQTPCDAVTLHVPKITTGPDCTMNLIGPNELAAMGGATLLNAARGGVIDEDASVRARTSGSLSGLWCDTFVGEPRPQPAIVAACDGATPHIAGHSIAGKLKVAWLPTVALREHLNLAPLAGDNEPLIAAVQAARGAEHRFDHVLDETHAKMAALAGRDFRTLRAAHRRQEGGVLPGDLAARALIEVGCPRILVASTKSL
ncbi:MAG: hypothetical protein KC502_15920 [Myxococcales bacterium]|nr:hypothetical protein [Myxococcales bacterium]